MSRDATFGVHETNSDLLHNLHYHRTIASSSQGMSKRSYTEEEQESSKRVPPNIKAALDNVFADALVQRVFGSRPTRVEQSGTRYLAEMRLLPKPSPGAYLEHLQAANPRSKDKYAAVWNSLKEFFTADSTDLSDLKTVADIDAFVKEFKEQEFMRDGEPSAPNTKPRVSTPDSETTISDPSSSRSSNNSSVSSTLSTRGIEKVRAEYELNFTAFQGESWTLSSGTCFDEVVAQHSSSDYELWLLSSFILGKESSLHSFIINHPDRILDLFPNPTDKAELEKVLIERAEERIKLTDQKEETYLRRYDKEPVVVGEMLSRGWACESQDPVPEGFRETVHLALHLIFVVYRNNQFKLPDESSESFFVHTLWGMINSIVLCDDSLKFKPAEVHSKASALRKNKERNPEDKQALGRKVDGIVASSVTLLELCVIEAANKDPGPNGTKALSDGRKLSKVLKDSFDVICARANTDIRSQLTVYGVRISAASITYYSLRKRDGRFYQMAEDGTLTFPGQWNETTTVTILTIVASILALRKRVSEMAQKIAQWTASSFELADPRTHPHMPRTLRTPPGSPQALMFVEILDFKVLADFPMPTFIRPNNETRLPLRRISQLTPSKVANLEIPIAQEPGKSISVPYKAHEPIFFLIERSSIKLGGRNDGGEQDDRLYMNGVLPKNHQESVARYRI
ncbi:MAG: hypothetical protein J3Q66DRAFT_407315 [Benniella sp.]|nr:MAG: hypothetical protein J3Q66DRAFT_407315 [Benniella sp.]